jgi:hypothetical protein
MKIIGKDNYDRETISDVLVAENVTKYYANLIVTLLNNSPVVGENDFYVAVADDYQLYKFVA